LPIRSGIGKGFSGGACFNVCPLKLLPDAYSKNYCERYEWFEAEAFSIFEKKIPTLMMKAFFSSNLSTPWPDFQRFMPCSAEQL
jgi:hypothetical protein